MSDVKGEIEKPRKGFHWERRRNINTEGKGGKGVNAK